MRLSLFNIALFGCLLACKDDDDPGLPAHTQNGKNTFGCLVNGKVMVPGGRYERLSAEVDSAGLLWLTSGNSDTEEHIYFVIDRPDFPFEVGVRYEFNNPGDIKCYYNLATTDAEADCQYEDAPVTGGITFTKMDWNRKIIAGTFEFTAHSDYCNKDVSVTEGRFDIVFDYH